MMSLLLRLNQLLPIVGLTVFAHAVGAAPLLELTVGDESYVGKSLGHDAEVCWLAQQDGRVKQVPLQQVTGFRNVGEPFRRMSTIDVRNELRREFGHGWEIVGTGHYLVCAPQGRARLFAQTFENLYRSFRSYFSRRGFDLPQPEFPMIAVIYPTQQGFAANCKKDGVPYVPGLRGYYHRLTNRTTLFESSDDRLAAEIIPDSSSLAIAMAQPNFASRWDGSIESTLKDTINHEATHQVAYNLGLHTRIGDNPKWVTEGLATMFEAEGTRANTGGRRPQERLNPERFERFVHYAEHRREPRSLAKFVMSDRQFQLRVLDAYAESWALTFFLAETRSSQHSNYLKLIAARDPMEPYTAEDRLEDFQNVFGKDLDRLEVAFLRYMDDLR